MHVIIAMWKIMIKGLNPKDTEKTIKKSKFLIFYLPSPFKRFILNISMFSYSLNQSFISRWKVLT